MTGKQSLCLGKFAVITDKTVKAGNREGLILILWDGFEAQDCLSAVKQLFIGPLLWGCLCSLAPRMMQMLGLQLLGEVVDLVVQNSDGTSRMRQTS